MQPIMNYKKILMPILLWILIFTAPVEGKEKKIILSLQQAIDRALEKNRSVLQSKNSIDFSKLSLASTQSDFDVKITPSAGFGVIDSNESIAAGLSLNKKFIQGMDITLSPGTGMGNDNFTSRVGISLGIPLFRGRGELANMASVRGAEYSLRSTNRALHRTRTNIIIQTVRNFYTISQYMKKVELNTFLVEKFKNHAALAKLKSDIGLAGPLDVYRAELKVKDAQADLADAVEALQNEKYELKSVLSISQDIDITLEEAPVDIKPINMDVASAEKITLENSIDIRHEKDAFKEIQRNSRIAKHNLLPDLKLSMDYSRSGGADVFEDAFSLTEDNWRVFLTSSTDFSRTREKLAYRQSLINIESARINLNTTKDLARKNLRSQLDTLANAQDLISIRKEQIHQAEGKKALAAIKFNNDMADNFNLIEAETELHQARLNLLNARINYIIGTYRLREIMGTLLAYHEE